jgi:hypothetical protein
MSDPLAWRAYYYSSDGRFRITGPALKVIQISHYQRVVTATLGGRPSKVILLDVPLRLGDRVPGSEIIEYYLDRIRLRDLAGWPPQLPSRTTPPENFVTDARLTSARFKARQGAALPCVEFELKHHLEPCKAMVTGPPVLLLKCLEATLKQEGTAGRSLSDLQEIRLVSPE